ncbi:hypothetical protein J4413_03895 [Candidatus Woesearchaeota archaeon]|nr:hypothetical protein [Candidatus Woesearchaeota archaeon]
MEKFYITPKGGLKIRFQGAADFGNVYKFMKLWLEDRGFADEKSLETKYTERRFGERKNLEIHWKGVHKISNYVSYHIEVTFLLLGISETEVQIGDIKRKLDKGDFELKIIGHIQYGTKDWEQYSFIDKIYYNLIMRKRLDDYKYDFYTVLYKFVDFIKERFGLRG